MTNSELRELKKLDNAIWRSLYPEDDSTLSKVNETNVFDFLYADLLDVFCAVDESEWKPVIIDRINASPVGTLLKRHINLNELKYSASVKKNWKAALESDQSAGDLAKRIKYNLSPLDMNELDLLQVNSHYHDKIRALVECCQAHNERPE